MLIPLKTFTGEYPRTNAALLPPNAAQYSLDCDFMRGSLNGLRKDVPVDGISGEEIKSLFVFDKDEVSNTFWWNRDVDAVRSPVVDDAYNRFYWSDGTGFYVSDGTVEAVGGEPDSNSRYMVGVPRPTSLDRITVLPGGPFIGVTIADEENVGALTDGLMINLENSASWNKAPEASYFTFAAREPRSGTHGIALLTITYPNGDSYQAEIRTAGYASYWPVEIPGYHAELSIVGTTWRISIIGALSDVYVLTVLPGGPFIQATVVDELSDGTYANIVPINVDNALTWVKTPTSATLSFTARAPVVTESTEAAVEAEAPTNLALAGTAKVGSSTGPEAKIYDRGAPNYDRLYYYDDPVVQPSSLYLYEIDPESGGYVSTRQVHQLAGTVWYAEDSSTTPPSTQTSSSTATVEEAVITESGAAVILNIIRSDGSTVTAVVREDSNKTSWPPEYPGYHAELTVSGTSWEVTIGVNGGDIERRAYAYSYVNQYGEEGPLSAPFEIDCASGTLLKLRYHQPAPGYAPIEKVRYYRTAPGSGMNYLFAGEVDVSTTNPWFSETLPTEALGEPATTANYYPPSQELRGITIMANGIMVGFKGNEAWFAEPYLAYAWNPNAIKPFTSNVMGILPFENGLYVTTTRNPRIVIGSAPESMTDTEVPALQAGVSKGSICSAGSFIVYASNDGLVMARGLEASLEKSYQFFTRGEWRDAYGDKLSLMRLSAHDGSLLAWFEDGTPGFLMRFEEEAPSLTHLSSSYTAAFVHPLSDALRVSDGTHVFTFRSDTDRHSFVWWSKDFVLPKPHNYGAVQLFGSGAVTLEVYADGALKLSVQVALDVSGGTIVRLPSGFLARRWSFKLYGDAEVEEMTVATSISELRGV